MKAVTYGLLTMVFLLSLSFAHAEEGLPITDADGNVIATAHVDDSGEFYIEGDVNDFTRELAKASLGANKENKPKILVSLVNNEMLNARLESEENPFEIGIKTDENAAVTELRIGTFSEPTMNVYVKDSVLTAVQTAENPATVLTAALDSGDIRLEGVGFANKFKLALVKIGLTIASWFA